MSAPAPARPRRRRSPGWVPNQHGAWAMLASPLLLGALAGGLSWRHLVLGAFWFAGYVAFFATSLWLKSGRKPRFLRPVQVYAAAAAVLGVLTLVLGPGLLRWAPLFALPLGVGLWAAAHRRERDLLAGLTTVVGSALMTVVAYDAAGGSGALPAVGAAGDLSRAAVLALVQLLYFGGTVCYVKSVIRERGVPAFLRLSIGWHGAATLVVAVLWATGLVAGWAAAALLATFVLLTARAAVVPRMSLSPKQIGIAEIGATLAVALFSLWAT
ncbi:MAG TPA: YwiC-like family protein [Dermatophilaceae bacterium]|nr:YwiC-like family protein [Dermatophilaceae bacterium]